MDSDTTQNRTPVGHYVYGALPTPRLDADARVRRSHPCEHVHRCVHCGRTYRCDLPECQSIVEARCMGECRVWRW